MPGFMFSAILLALLAVALATAMLWQRAPRLAVALALGLPLAAGGLYWLKGRPEALDAANRAPAKSAQVAAVQQLQQELAKAPESFENQVVLARSHMALGEFDAAAKAYARAMELHPDDADLGVEYAEAQLRGSADRRFPPSAVALLEQAIAKNADNQRALFFLGLQRMQAGQPAEASRFWERLLPMLPPDAAHTLQPQVAAAREAAGLPALPDSAFAGAPGIDVEVGIDPTLAGSIGPNDVLYVFARAEGGKGPPLAVKQVQPVQFPIKLRLADADSPMPAGKLSEARRFVLQARISKSGEALPASGDLEADPVAVDRSGAPVDHVQLVINRTVP